ncbi:MAG: hypothetical protein JWM47_3358 [Acidimicrobiales bacterium]|nr:hypothetical protein [Acidimicrobiales bacterium]
MTYLCTWVFTRESAASVPQSLGPEQGRVDAGSASAARQSLSLP